jgi:hypothetical protein
MEILLKDFQNEEGENLKNHLFVVAEEQSHPATSMASGYLMDTIELPFGKAGFRNNRLGLLGTRPGLAL